MIPNAVLPELRDVDANIEDLFESSRSIKVDLEVDARPSDSAVFRLKDRLSDRSEEGVLRLFHVLGDRREMGDPRRIGLAELNPSFKVKIRHEISQTFFVL